MKWVEGSSKSNPIWQIMNNLNNLDNYNCKFISFNIKILTWTFINFKIVYSDYDTILAANQNGNSSQTVGNLFSSLSIN